MSKDASAFIPALAAGDTLPDDALPTRLDEATLEGKYLTITDAATTYLTITNAATTYVETPATPAALTAADAGVVDATYGAEESAVITNLRTRVNELEAALRALGLLA